MPGPEPVSSRLPWSAPRLTPLVAAAESAKSTESAENGTTYGPS